VVTSDAYRELGEAAWSWVLSHVAEDDGPWMPSVVVEDWRETAPPEDRDSLYSGIAGLAPVLAEIAQYRALRDTEQELSRAVVTRLSAMARTRTEPSLYDGLGGDATALRLLAPGTESVAMQRLAELATPAGWKTTQGSDPGSDAPFTDITAGSAGIVLAAVWAGGEYAGAIATTGGEALVAAADETPAGLDWGMLPGSTSRGPNYSHGTGRRRGRVGHSRDRVETPGLRRSRLPRRPAPAHRGFAGRRRVHRPAHHPAHHHEGG
jgi:hypothetical protein